MASKQGEYSEEGSVGVGGQGNGPIPIHGGCEGQGQVAVGLLEDGGHDIGKGSSHNKGISRGSWEKTEGGIKAALSSREPRGHLRNARFA